MSWVGWLCITFILLYVLFFMVLYIIYELERSETFEINKRGRKNH